jgi:hypothetical protein
MDHTDRLVSHESAAVLPGNANSIVYEEAIGIPLMSCTLASTSSFSAHWARNHDNISALSVNYELRPTFAKNGFTAE